ncbi:hypothetical protein [Nocardiopsis sp. NRRL B-16309]|uniref:hypothetical protein n=1 Tax=Nocardiopsis sp. NRRL B-16309 TaxID=1519494 RepID=UPI000A8CB08C|nr:hypothetical protein [Nocardiopsis sp. NRRL B-16309]
MSATNDVYVGNAGRDALADRGRILGHFREVGDARHSDAVGVTWGVTRGATSGPDG